MTSPHIAAPRTLHIGRRFDLCGSSGPLTAQLKRRKHAAGRREKLRCVSPVAAFEPPDALAEAQRAWEREREMQERARLTAQANLQSQQAGGDSQRPKGRPRRRRRLIALIRSVPDRFRIFFRGRPTRQYAWTLIGFGAGYYTGNVVTLAFGTLAVNDVVAGAVFTAIVEFITYIYYKAERPTLTLKILNASKLGFMAALICDAIKLAG
mmetsp:Transcript_10911/g.30879  ORF Transcript_10911/g.30879 Transcript_10911/m.30879 type:complete len:209 (+) Transcript_10911:493-1119(+)|eukprot:CAMPEP_0117656956 /NCGR_PEP_ID=MMETSP0804-20121206/5076_1 /TAXON_ID=1074897 /ORGANISM="Tetraselmis astigmatica, Strain CCMP880" /LENGTH=208 /DNA_ID=CAMNT_0005463383 /DNA_START=482 /DNA_END=1108 /DNA_ORIENTATION=-